MSPTILIKIIVSMFLLNRLFWHGARYLYLAFQNVSEDKLRSYFKQVWINSFWMLLNLFGVALIWFPTLLQADFFSNPIPTLLVAIVTSVILATSLAVSAKDPSESIIFWQKILDSLESAKENTKQDK